MSYTLINADCFEWMAERAENSITAIVTDPPYGVKEYTDEELERRRRGEGGGNLARTTRARRLYSTTSAALLDH